MELYCNSKKRSQGEMVDEEIYAWISEGYIYWHLAGYYMQYIVVICTICSNGGKVFNSPHSLEIEMFTILVLFNGNLRITLGIQNVPHYCRPFHRYRNWASYCSTFQVCDSPGNHWKQSTMQRTKANLKDGACQWLSLVWSHKTHRPCWFTDKNKVPFSVSQCRCETVLKQDILLFTGAHLSKVMAWKIWMSLKGNRDYKAIIHFLSHWQCHHSIDRLT